MKKMYMILGNKPFEDKLLEQLSQLYKPGGSCDGANDKALAEMSANEVDAVIVRESLAESPQEFIDFIRTGRENNPHLKIIAIIQQRPIGDSMIYRLAELGVFDVINGGTKLADVIEMSMRDSTHEHVFHLLTQAQQGALLAAPTASDEAESSEFIEEDISIEIEGELQIDVEQKAAGFKERYMSGITQVYASSPESEDGEPKTMAPEITFNELASAKVVTDDEPEMPIAHQNEEVADPFGFHLPGLASKAHIVEEVVEEALEPATEETVIPEKTEDNFEMLIEDTILENNSSKGKPDTKSIRRVELTEVSEVKEVRIPEPILAPNKNESPLSVHLVAHCLMSSIGMQYAVLKSKKQKIAYIETDCRNKTLQASCEKAAIKYFWTDDKKELLPLIKSVLSGGYDEVVLNSSDPSVLSVLTPDLVQCEILQDKESAAKYRDLLSSQAKLRVIVSYFEPDLVSVKTLNKLFGRPSVRWTNTRTEEYNSRLNSKLLVNDAITELTKEV